MQVFTHLQIFKSTHFQIKLPHFQIRFPSPLDFLPALCGVFVPFVVTLFLKLASMKTLLFTAFLALTISTHAQFTINWDDPILVDEQADLGTAIQPKVAADSDGNVVVTWGHTGITGDYCYTSRLVDGQFTASEYINTSNATVGSLQSSGPHIDEHDGVFFISYEYGAPNKIVTRKSVDGGETWEPEVLADLFAGGLVRVLHHMSIDGDGNPHVSMVRVDGGTVDIGATCSVDGGDSYTLFIPAAESPGLIISAPSIEIDGNRHVIVWSIFDEPSSEARLFASISTNNGASFEEPVLIHTETDAILFEDNGDPQACIHDDTMVIVWESASEMTMVHYANLDIPSLEVNGIYDLPNSYPAGAVFENPCVSCGENFWGTMFHYTDDGTHTLGGVFNLEAQDLTAEIIGSGMVDVAQQDVHFVAEPTGPNSYDLHAVYLEDGGLSIWYMHGVFEWSFVSVPAETSKISMYPNPASDLLTLNFPSEFVGQQVLIYDQSARKAMEFRVESVNMTIELDDLAQGNYTISTPGMKSEKINISR